MTYDLAELRAMYDHAASRAMLSPRQHQAMSLWHRGLSLRQSATAMGIQPSTVTEHRRRALNKLEATAG